MNNRTLAVVIIAIGLLSVLTLAMSVTALLLQPPAPSPTAEALPSTPADESPAAITSAGERVSCELMSVVDGDTLVVRVGGKQKHVRLLRIDAVESDHPDYVAATRALGKMVGGGRLTLEFEGGGAEETDQHGRLLCYVWAGDTLVNLEMVRTGWSRFFTRYGTGKYAEAFRRAEAEAFEEEEE